MLTSDYPQGLNSNISTVNSVISVTTLNSSSSSITSSGNLTEPHHAQWRPWDHSDPFFSAHTRDVISTLFKCYIRQILIFLGIPGNIICCVVFIKQGVSDRINLLLFALAAADLIHLLNQLLGVTPCYHPPNLQSWYTILNAKVAHVTNWANGAAGYLIMIMSLDRCLCVVMPLKAGRLLSYRPMVAAILLSYLVPFGIFLFIFFAFTVSWRVDPSTNRSIAYITGTPGYPVDTRQVSLIGYLLNIVIKPVLFVTVAVCCIVTIIQLRRASRKRLQMSGGAKERSESEDSKITTMLLFLCILYNVVLFLDICTALTYTLVPEFYLYKKYHNTFIIVHACLIYPGYCLNSTANFFAYLMLSTKFRRTLKQLFCCFGGQRK